LSSGPSDIREVFPDLRSADSAFFARIAIRKSVLLIAMTPRTGSTWLCDEFEATCAVGKVTEVFNPRGPVQYSGCWETGRTFEDYISCFAGRLSGPAFAFKTSWYDFAPIAPYARVLFPDLRVVFVKRRSIEAQALSHYCASKTGQWHLKSGDAGGRKRPEHLNLSEIDAIVEYLENEVQAWRAFFERSKLLPEEIYYEDFRHNVADAVALLARVIGVTISAGTSRSPAIQKLGDDDDPWLEEIVRHRQNQRT
jgi:trehalose 2-sulfotransferase